jgi:Amt family ammonium transporter
MNTTVAGAAGMLGWLLVERLRDGRPTSFGAASGAVAGLVAITPSGGYVEVLGAIAVGLAAGVVCSYAVSLKHRMGYDDSLDVAGVHMVGGILGTLAVGLLGTRLVNGAGVDGLAYGGGLTLLGHQAVGVLAVLVYAFVVTYAVGTVLDRTIGFRISRDAELEGIDLVEHAESAYELDGVTGAGLAFAGGALGGSTGHGRGARPQGQARGGD